MQTMETKPCRKKAAGQDPHKRKQILDGARRIFMNVGFDAASMNDITREAGVSKGTIYVYFENKEDLFLAMINEDRMSLALHSANELKDELPIAHALFNYGVSIAKSLTTDEYIKKMRMLISVSNRQAGITNCFFSTDFDNVWNILQRYLDRHCEMEKLYIDNTALAAIQFIELASARLIKRRLMNDLKEEPTLGDIHFHVAPAVRIFMRAYEHPTEFDPLAGIKISNGYETLI